MSDTHIIRLRGPWEYEVLARTAIAADGTRQESSANLPRPGRIHLPVDWGQSLGADFRGRVRYTRRFGLPTNLEPHERVWLAIDGVDYFGVLTLNGEWLGEIVGYQTTREFDVTAFLRERNVFVLEVELPRVEWTTGREARTPHSPFDKLTAGEPLSLKGRGEYDSPAIDRPGRENLPGGPIGEVRLEIRADQ